MSSNTSGDRGQGAGEDTILHPAGFTLLEVMLSVAILSLIVTVIYASFSTAESSVKQAEEIRDQTDLARTLITRLSDDIHNAYCSIPGKSVFYGKKQELDISGTKRRLDSIQLTTLTNSRTRNTKETDLWLVGYSFKEKADGSGHVLMRQEKKDLSGTESLLEGITEYEITDRVEELHLAYFTGSIPLNEESGSSTTCIPPKAVEISLTLNDGSFYKTKVDVAYAKYTLQ